jgi:hypothetical protein
METIADFILIQRRRKKFQGVLAQKDYAQILIAGVTRSAEMFTVTHPAMRLYTGSSQYDLQKMSRL